MGAIGSIFDTVGKVSSTSALSYGPGGPSNALVEMAGPYLVIVVALLSWRMIKPTEVVALILCVHGSLFLVIPESMKALWCCRCRRREPDEEVEKVFGYDEIQTANIYS